jgi:thiamine biosynthesis lipoprotein
MKIKKRIIFTVFAALVFSAVFTSCGLFTPKLQKVSRFMMDTYVTIQAPGGAETTAAINRAMDRMEEIDKKFSILDPDSILYKFNNSGTPVTDPEIIKIIQRAIHVSELSGGKFDVTVYPLMKLWGFYATKHLPSKAEIKETLKDVGYKYLSIKDGKMTKLKKGVGVDIGGIAKLYAVEEGSNVLKKAGIKSALLDAGGDIYAIGTDNGRPWKVGIRNPRGDGVIAAVDVTDMLVVSSGDYERFFIQDGVRYHHIMDPFTGYPSRGVSSSTIFCSDPALADGLSAAVFLLGKDRGFELAKKLGYFEAMVITEDQKIYYSEGLGKETRVVKVKDLPKQ